MVLARYTDLLTTYFSVYNSTLKIVYIAAHCCIIGSIRCSGQIASTYERDQDDFPHWKFLVAPSSLLAVLLTMHRIAARRARGWHLFYLQEAQELLWKFSIILEPVAIVPQLALLRKYRIVENLTSDYVFLMGVYRFLYILNWVWRAHHQPGYRHNYLAYVCGCLQVALYFDFFYYWFISKREGRSLRYGDEGDAEYYDCNVNELRNYDNSTALIDSADLRLRAKPASSGVDEEMESLIED